MITNYMISALRSLFRHPSATLINILGLVLAVTILSWLSLYIIHEISYDRQWPAADQIFSFRTTLNLPNGRSETFATAPAPLADSLTGRFSAVEAVTSVIPAKTEPLIFDNETSSLELGLTDTGFFDFFPVDLITGTLSGFPRTPSALALSESAAIKVFGRTDVIDRIVRLGEDAESFQIVAVYKDFPTKSHIRMPAIASINSSLAKRSEPASGSTTGEWSRLRGYTFARIPNPQDVSLIKEQLSSLPPENPDIEKITGQSFIELEMMNIRDLHLAPNVRNAMKPPGNVQLLLSAITVFIIILMISTVNFINLSIARFMRRIKEFSIRRVLGAGKKDIFFQSMSESLLYVLIAILIALPICGATLGIFSQITGIVMGEAEMYGLPYILGVFCYVIVLGILAGIYPALAVFRHEPRQAITVSSGSKQSLRMRSILLTGQFATVVGIMSCLFVVLIQVHHVSSLPSGFDYDDIIMIDMENNNRLATSVEQRLNAESAIETVALTGYAPGTNGFVAQASLVSPSGQAISYNLNPVSASFFSLLNISSLAGDLPSRAWRPNTAVVTLATVEALGWESSADAIGRTISVPVKNITSQKTEIAELEIIGVTTSLLLKGPKSSAEAWVFVPVAQALTPQRRLLVKAKSGQLDSTFASINKVLNTVDTQRPSTAVQLSQFRDTALRDEQRVILTLILAAIVSISITLVGLYGFALIVTRSRVKEMSIRRVVGASAFNVFMLFWWQFSKPMIIASLLSFPIVWWVLTEWLNNFVHRIDLSPLPLIIAGILTMLIAWLVLGLQVVSVTRINPALSLRLGD